MKFLFKLASRSRPQKFIAALENIYSNVKNKDFIIFASLDQDDTSMYTQDMFNRIKMYKNLIVFWGFSKNKIDAINRDLEIAPPFDVLINMSDDMAFIEKGFDTIIEEQMNKHFPEGDCLLHFPDQNQGSNCMTMSIMDKKYFDRFGYIYNPEYESLECDVEAMEVGKRLGRYKYIDKILFYHYHPSFGQAKYDEQYLKTEASSVRLKDKETYNRRMINNFYL